MQPNLLEADTAELVAIELGCKVKIVDDDDVLKDIQDIEDNEKRTCKKTSCCYNYGAC